MMCLRRGHESVAELARPVSREAAMDNKHYVFWTSKESRAQLSLIKNVLTWNGNSIDINMEHVVIVYGIGWDPRGTDMGMEICKWLAYCGVSSGAIPVRKWGRQDWAEGEVELWCICQQRPQPLPQGALGLVWFSRYVPNWSKGLGLSTLRRASAWSSQFLTGGGMGAWVLETGSGLGSSASTRVYPLHHSDRLASSHPRRVRPGWMETILDGLFSRENLPKEG